MSLTEAEFLQLLDHLIKKAKAHTFNPGKFEEVDLDRAREDVAEVFRSLDYKLYEAQQELNDLRR
jgi:hypothetical protein